MMVVGSLPTITITTAGTVVGWRWLMLINL